MTDWDFNTCQFPITLTTPEVAEGDLGEAIAKPGVGSYTKLQKFRKTKEIIMSCWTKEELENMLEDVVNELDLSDSMIEKHGPLGTPPAELVRLVLDQKDMQIRALKQGFAIIK